MWGPEPVTTRRCWRGLRARRGTVVAYEAEHDLAQNGIRNLSDFSNVTVQERSGPEAPLPACNAIYVNAGATAPLDVCRK